MKKVFLSFLFAALVMPVFAEDEIHGFESDERLEEGFATHYLNKAIEKGMASADAATDGKKMKYGRKVSDYVSAPKFGGYYIGKYSYSDKAGAKGGDGFTQRLIRMYVDGSILKDFKYRIQIQLNNASFHMKDVFIEWAKYDFFKVKVGQYKRAFGFENPMNPWDISTGDYSITTKKLTGHADYLGENTSNGGRDQGIQVQGDFFKVGKDNHYLFHYQVGLWNGQGINTKDLDGRKDFIGTFQVQPIKNLYVGFFGWTGTFVDANKNVLDRNRYAFGVKYDENGYVVRAEYMHGQSNAGNADSWYIVGGIPVNDWFKISAQYQCFRMGKEWGKSQNIYSLIPEFQLHKNLKFQIQYNFNNDRTLADHNYNEIWGEFYFRF